MQRQVRYVEHTSKEVKVRPLFQDGSVGEPWWLTWDRVVFLRSDGSPLRPDQLSFQQEYTMKLVAGAWK